MWRSRTLVKSACAAALGLSVAAAAWGAEPATRPATRPGGRTAAVRGSDGRSFDRGSYERGSSYDRSRVPRYPLPNGHPVTREELPAAYKAAEKAAAESHDRLNAAQAQVRNIQEMMRSISGRMEASPEVLRQALVKLEDEQQTMELETAASQARRHAVEEAVAEATVRMEKRVGSDQAVQEMAKVVEAREKSLAQLRKGSASGLATPQDVSDAEATLADARAKLAVQREQAASSAGGDGVTSLNRELVNLLIADREREARLAFIKERVDRFGKALRQVDDLEKAQLQLSKADKAANNADASVNSIRHVMEQAELDHQAQEVERARP